MSRLSDNNYLRLTKVLMKSETMESSLSKSKRVLFAILGVIAVLCIIIPACVLVGVMAYIMTTAVVQADGNEQGLAMILMFIAAFSVIFGISVILNVFYFSNDMNYILPLPLQPWEIIAAKFTTAYINESIMEFLVIVSAMIGYIAATKVTVLNIIVSVFAMITIPILPLVYCGIICIVGMTFTRFIKNKDAVHRFTGVTLIIFILIILAGADVVGGIDIDNYAASFVNGTNTLFNVLGVIFIHVKLICQAASGNVLSLLMYCIVNIIAILIFLFVAQKFYIKGVVGLNSSGRTGKQSGDSYIDKYARKRAWEFAYLKKEFIILFRTPAYLMSCILINLIWPVLIIVVYKMQSSDSVLFRLLINYSLGNEKLLVYVPVIISVTAILVTAANSLASGAITREGSAFPFMKYIPISPASQLNIKALVSIIISQTGMTIYIAAAAVYVGIPITRCLFYSILSLLGVIFVTYLGIALDSVNPKLLWEDEMNSLRGNSTIFFSMAYSMILGVIMIAVSYVLLEYTRFSVNIINLIIMILLIILDVVAYINVRFTSSGNIEEL